MRLCFGRMLLDPKSIGVFELDQMHNIRYLTLMNDVRIKGFCTKFKHHPRWANSTGIYFILPETFKVSRTPTHEIKHHIRCSIRSIAAIELMAKCMMFGIRLPRSKIVYEPTHGDQWPNLYFAIILHTLIASMVKPFSKKSKIVKIVAPAYEVEMNQVDILSMEFEDNTAPRPSDGNSNGSASGTDKRDNNNSTSVGGSKMDVETPVNKRKNQE